MELHKQVLSHSLSIAEENFYFEEPDYAIPQIRIGRTADENFWEGSSLSS